jgi:D-glycero-alpha-D-manno-heptose-7-phosphate kinase
MIITRTPYRISFFGGGTDYPAHYKNHGGSVLATTIDKYCYISLRKLPPFFDHKHRIVYSAIENVVDVDQIKHPAVRECLKYAKISDGLEIHHDGDLPARSGLGSSSSFTVGLLHSLFAYKERFISKSDLAEAAIYVEQEMINENVGSQDQTLASYGGLNQVKFNCISGTHLDVTPLCINRSRLDELQQNLMLFFTGIFRVASDVAGEQIKITPRKTKELTTMASMVDEATQILAGNDTLDCFGELLHQGWKIKRSLTNKISSSPIDELYNKARAAGAIGGKLLGAGGGGVMLFYVKPENQQKVMDSLNLLHVPFRFEYSGSKVIFYDPR